MKKFIKNILNSDGFITIAAFIIAMCIRLIFYTIRWQFDIKKFKQEFANDNLVYFFWHGRMLMMPFFAPQPHNTYVLISHHKDGKLIARTMEILGIKTVRGSSSKGGVKAALSIINDLKDSCIAITPDGPRGPIYSIKESTLELVKLTGKKIMFVSYATSHAKKLGTWDKMIIPKLFSTGYFIHSKPIIVENNTNEDYIHKLRENLEHEYRLLTDNLDKKMNI